MDDCDHLLGPTCSVAFYVARAGVLCSSDQPDPQPTTWTVRVVRYPQTGGPQQPQPPVHNLLSSTQPLHCLCHELLSVMRAPTGLLTEASGPLTGASRARSSAWLP